VEWIDSVAVQGGAAMSDLFSLSTVQMRRIKPYFTLSNGVARVDDRNVISGIIFVITTGAASTPATTDAPAPACPPSASPQPSSSGYDQEVLSLGKALGVSAYYLLKTPL
jgi:hypothetical protein